MYTYTHKNNRSKFKPSHAISPGRPPGGHFVDQAALDVSARALEDLIIEAVIKARLILNMEEMKRIPSYSNLAMENAQFSTMIFPSFGGGISHCRVWLPEGKCQ